VLFILLKIGFAATDSLAVLKLIDAGVPKENIIIIHTTILVVEITVPLVVAKYTTGPKPLNTYLTVIPIR